MDDKSRMILKIQELALNDDNYRLLMEEYAQRNARFLKVMAQLNKEQRNAIYDYFGVVIEMQQRLMMLAVEMTSTVK